MFTRIGRGMLSAFNPEKSETPLVTMFRTEFFKEYSHAKKYGVNVNERFVKEFLAEQKIAI